MKFVALISGGKDSFFNIHHCISRGHELIALANLYPAQKDQHEIDSFMFQTVGHDIIDCYRECMDVPLYRQAINGSSSNQELEYSKTEDDEIEDLYLLLKNVKEKHPDVKGVSCGAILSHYQRTRVENVCGRLDLTSLAFLWQRDQSELMQEMCASGLDARIIKVAAVGLTSSHLGKSIQELFPHLLKLNAMYEVHICGEGGEFETIVLDASFFKKKKISIMHKDIIENHSDDVAYLKLQVELVDKEPQDFTTLEEPRLLLEEFSTINDDLNSSSISPFQYQLNNAIKVQEQPIQSTVISTDTKLYISNLVSSASTLDGQIIDVFEMLKDILDQHDLTFNDIQHVQLLLSDMSMFSSVNKAYSKSFENIYLPPSRVCVQTKLNSKYLLQISCIALKSNKNKKGIHIRSISYWAPHNIGPYSQYIVDERTSYKLGSVSGQIPLLPSTMSFGESNYKFESVLALQHLFKVKSLVNVKKIASITCFLTNTDHVSTVCKTWESYIENFEDSESLPRFNIVEVDALPRNALVEWAGLSFENITGMYEDDDTEEENIALDDIFKSLVEKFDSSSTLYLGKGSITIVLLFSNDLEQIKELAEINTNKNYLQVSTTLSNINTLVSDGYNTMEFLPVKNNFNYKGEKFDFSILWKIEN